jgi:hypothetical protein
VIIPFATQSYKHPSLPISAQRTINCYAEREPPDAKTQVAVLESPGLSTFATLGSGPIRNAHMMGGVLYVVSGPLLYSVSLSGVRTVLGGSVGGSGYVLMSDNGTQLLIINGTFGYIYTVASGFQVITDPNFHASTSAAFFDNYFVFSWDGTNKFFISNSLDGTTYSGTDFASAEVAPDNVMAIVNQQENLLIFGQQTIETWYDAGAVNFPFLRIDGGTIERGCAAALSLVKEDNSVFFLGDDRIKYRLDGTLPRRVSQHAIEGAWQKYSSVSDAYSFSYTWDGHKLVVLTFPAANATWVYDISTGLWHERESRDMNNNSYGRWRGSCAVNAYNKILIGDAFSGQLGFLDPNTFTEFGATMVASMVGPSMNDDRKRMFFYNLELDMETGVGNTVDPGSNPQVMMDYSDDGGRTFSVPQSWRSLGAIGQYKQRVRWPGTLGQSRDRRFRVQISDPVPRRVIAARADVTPGMA